MRRLLALLMVGGIALAAAAGGEAGQGAPRVALIDIEGGIGPATAAYLAKAHRDAVDDGVQAVLLRIDTPGGLDSAMRDMIKVVLASPVPVIGYVGPDGARAASAGTYLLYATHVAAMAPATNLGAATPVPVGGSPTPASPPKLPSRPAEQEDAEAADEEAAPAGGDAMRNKVLNDAVAYIRGLAERRGRNADWAERAVREGASLTAAEALAQQVIDHVAPSIPALLAQIDGQVVELADGPVTLALAEAEVVAYAPDWRFSFLSIITNPTIAYMLMLAGLYGLLLEGYSPGAILPGTVGAICLLLALYAFQILPINYAGLALMAVGLVLMVAEALAPSFGVLGIGGVVAFVLGSVLLMDTDVPGFGIDPGVIGGVALAAALGMALIIYLLVRARRAPAATGSEGTLEGQLAEVRQLRDGQAWAFVAGEHWRVDSDRPLQPGDRVRVLRREGLRLRVEPLNPQEPSS